MAQQFTGFKPTAGVSRAQTVVAAHANSRRQVVGGLVLGMAALLPSTSQAAKYPSAVDIEIFDDRKAKKDVDRLVDAMDPELSFQERDGLTQAIAGKEQTKARIVASKKLILGRVKSLLDSSVWWEATGTLRGELGFLRYDIAAVAETLPRAQKRSLLILKKKLFEEIEEFDIACGQGIRPERADKELALKLFGQLSATLEEVAQAVAVA